MYRGFKVMPYSVGCYTTLSNFEAGLNYKDVSDPSIMISFPLLEDVDGAAMVAWTTTPWNLPSNLALRVNMNFTYVKAQCKVPNGDVSKVMYTSVNRDNPKSSDKKSGEKKADLGSYKILTRMSGSELAGKRYQPLFDYFLELSSVAFKVLSDEYVKEDSGMGVVHCAPAFGEDDYRVCLNEGIIDSRSEESHLPSSYLLLLP
ncbi:hypothetical protein GOP47_0010332 [Adiantum capillus-veneris]|uniref:Aminoacyl-tRNA synthetase class Ia domain-containing protein n=1 Tax=Adiantum capillus-veneris TaxID=13818 RepID=A0A9D4UUY4_ADICA|nr:hypothetical protein GOP47_0010332 [Adiantum capillus-veneris]